MQGHMKSALKNNIQDAVTPIRGSAATAILDIAERLAQTRGYNGFSYADVAAELGVTKASLHYHFRSKEVLGCALVARYSAAFGGALQTIAGSASDPREKLRQYVGLYEAVMRNDRMCLCGMLAAEIATLPDSMQAELRQFFDMNEQWLADFLDAGRRSGAFSFSEAAIDRARLMIGALEGAMLVARSFGDLERFAAAAGHLQQELTAK